MPLPHSDPGRAEKTDRGTRLDSWKEVAAYLGRGERTVKRWERERGLPAYRVPGGGRACVYSYTAELDRWLGSDKAHGLDNDPNNGKKPETTRSTRTTDPSLKDPPQTSTSTPLAAMGRWHNRVFPRLVFGCALLVFMVGTISYVHYLRTGEVQLPAALHSLFMKSSQKSALTDPDRAPDSEKSLAHDLYLKGRYEWNQRTPDSLNRALDYFTQAIVHDPANARAYAGLADTYILLREYTTMPESEAYARALAAAKKAVELDDSLSEAHRALAFAETNGNWDFVRGEKEFHRAIQLNPTDPLVRLWFANAFAFPGRLQESLEEVNKAQELDPSSHAILADKGMLLFKAGKKEEGIDLLREVERTDPEFRSPHFYLMLISFWVRDYPSYLLEGEKTAETVNDAVQKDIIAAARAGYLRDGERGLLRDLYAAQAKFYSQGKLAGMMLARTCLRMGKEEEALQLMEEDYARHNVIFLWCLSDPDLLSLKDEPRYQELRRKINLPPVPQDGSPKILTETDKTSFPASFRHLSPD